MNTHKQDLENAAIMGGREYGISTVLFRHAVGSTLGVNATDMECLAVLFFKGISTPKELSQHTGLSSGATTAMLDRLEKGGLVRRGRNPDDGRGVIITVAGDAKQKVGPLFASVRAAQSKLVHSYSAEQLKLIVDYFGRSVEMWEHERHKLEKSTD